MGNRNPRNRPITKDDVKFVLQCEQARNELQEEMEELRRFQAPNSKRDSPRLRDLRTRATALSATRIAERVDLSVSQVEAILNGGYATVETELYREELGLAA